MPIYCGCPSISTITCPEPPLRPRTEILPAAPPETPYPIMPREVEKNPGTCSVSTGSREGVKEYSMVGRSRMLTVRGRCRISVLLRVPVTTTCERVSVRTPAVSAGCSKLRASAPEKAATHRKAAERKTFLILIVHPESVRFSAIPGTLSMALRNRETATTYSGGGHPVFLCGECTVSTYSGGTLPYALHRVTFLQKLTTDRPKKQVV